MSDYPICSKILEFQEELIDLQENDEEKFSGEALQEEALKNMETIKVDSL